MGLVRTGTCRDGHMAPRTEGITGTGRYVIYFEDIPFSQKFRLDLLSNKCQSETTIEAKCK